MAKIMKCTQCKVEIEISNTACWDTCPKCGCMKLNHFEKENVFKGSMESNFSASMNVEPAKVEVAIPVEVKAEEPTLFTTVKAPVENNNKNRNRR